MDEVFGRALASLPNLKATSELLSYPTLPAKETDFKRVFDEFSLDVSYKQRYLDSNAFVVYYTKGFDGPGRESIETEDPQQRLMTAQYGYRNDAWVALDEARAELAYLVEEKQGNGQGQGQGTNQKDLKGFLSSAKKAVDDYLLLAPKEDVDKARATIAVEF